MEVFQLSLICAIEYLSFALLIRLIDRNNELTLIQMICVISIGTFASLVNDFFNNRLNILITVLVTLICFRVLTKNKTLSLLTDLLIAAFLYFGIQLLISSLLSILNINIMDNSLLLYGMLILIVFGLILLIKFKFITTIFKRFYQPYRNAYLIGFLVLFILTIAISSIWWKFENTAYDNAIEMLIIISLFLIVIMLLIISLINIINVRRKNRMISEYSEHLKEKTAELYSREHEYKNQLQAILGLLESGDSKQIKEKVTKYITGLLHKKENDGEAFITDNVFLSGLMFSFSRIASERDVTLDNLIESHSLNYPIKEDDLRTILSNLVDNAIDETSKLDKDKRDICITYRSDSIEVKNRIGQDFDESLIYRFSERGFSTKGNGRGYGLNTVFDIVDKNKFDLIITLEEDFLVFNLYFEKEDNEDQNFQ